MNRQTIFISGYPKSGNTWLTRLLGDVLNSPTGGCMPSEDTKEVATEGQDRPGPYIVRKGHFVLIDDDGSGEIVPRPHRLAWRRLTNEKIVFLVRDPRDICVSGAYHWRQTLKVFLEKMLKGDVAKCGRWDEYCDRWLGLFHVMPMAEGGMAIVKYEDLLDKPYLKTPSILDGLGCEWHRVFLYEAVRRQSFSTRKAQIGNDKKELRRNNMRKGIVGDWKNNFTPQMSERIWSEFGWMMERLGYEQDKKGKIYGSGSVVDDKWCKV